MVNNLQTIWIVVKPISVAVLQWGGWGLLFLLCWQIFKNGERLDRWIARLERLLLWVGLKRDKRFVSKDIRWRINSASKKINKEAEGVVTKGVDIVWVNQENIESYLRAGKVVIRMKHYSNQDQNISEAVSHYVQRGVLHTGKIYLPEKIKTALDLALTKKILSEESEESTSLEYFSINKIEPLLKSDRDLEQSFATIEKMEEKGLLTRILLREIRALGKLLYPRRVEHLITNETSNFFSFLEPFANHQTGGDISEWNFLSNNIRIGILYVASKTKLDKLGLEPYKKRLEEKIKKGCKRIYIFGRNDLNISSIKDLTRQIQKEVPSIRVHREQYSTVFRSETVPAVCATIQVD